jgi:BolA protein
MLSKYFESSFMRGEYDVWPLAYKTTRNAEGACLVRASRIEPVKLARQHLRHRCEKETMSVERDMREKLMVALRPTRLDVVNESHLHAGHRSSPGTGESHFRVLIVSEAFTGKSRVERHRLVNAALSDELKGRVHALAVTAYAPGETVPSSG